MLNQHAQLGVITGVRPLAFGLAAGYILGVRVRRQRYEQIAKVSSKVRNSEPTQARVGKMRDTAGADYSLAKAKFSLEDDNKTEVVVVEL